MISLRIEIIRKISKPVSPFRDHFKNFENNQAVQKIFGEQTQDVLDNLEVEFTDSTIYMRVDYDGRLLVNPRYLASGDLTELYLDVIHELVHVRQVLNGKNCNHALPYVERPLELEAYQTAVDEARALGWSKRRILRYLDSDLINCAELRKLAAAMGIDAEEESLPEEND
jgi:hypothetical protein